MTPATQTPMPMQPGMMNPMMNGVMPMMGMNPMQMMGGGMMPMMGGMMPMMPMMGMGGMMPMMMPMRMPMMARMTCEMGKEGMICRVMPVDAGSMELMKDSCDAMSSMMAMGMPVMMMCNGMPMVVCTAK